MYGVGRSLTYLLTYLLVILSSLRQRCLYGNRGGHVPRILAGPWIGSAVHALKCSGASVGWRDARLFVVMDATSSF